MAIPEAIPVSRDGGDHSSCIGVYGPEDGENMFWGRVVATFSRPPDPRPANWYPEKRWYAVLHKFNGWGHHFATEHWFAGVSTPQGEQKVVDQANAKLDEMLAELEQIQYADDYIEIRLFQVEIDG